MKSIPLHFLIALILIVGVQTVHAGQRGFVAVSFKDKTGVRNVTLYKRSFALIIGNDHYDDPAWVSLSNAINDARAIAKELTARGFSVTLENNLNSVKLKRVIEDFIYEKGRHKDARLFIWYAGHGHTIKGEGYLVPTDAPSPDVEDWKFRRKALSLREFGRFMREARSKHVLTIFDSCFSGTVFSSARSRVPPAISRATTKTVRQFVSSGEAKQAVSDDGLFRKLFLDAITGRDARADMNGDGYVIGSELGLFLHQRVANLTRNRQTPRSGKLNAYGYDLGDFVFRINSQGAKKVKPRPKAPIAKPARPPQSTFDMRTAELTFFDAIKGSKDIDKYKIFLKKFPKGIFSDLARYRIRELSRKKVAALSKPETSSLREKKTPATSTSQNIVKNTHLSGIKNRLAGRVGDQKRGQTIFLNRKTGNCFACHKISNLATKTPDNITFGEIGPVLDGVGARYPISILRLLIVDATKYYPNTIMPSFYRTHGLTRVGRKYRGKTILSSQEVEDVVAFLVTLK